MKKENGSWSENDLPESAWLYDFEGRKPERRGSNVIDLTVPVSFDKAGGQGGIIGSKETIRIMTV